MTTTEHMISKPETLHCEDKEGENLFILGTSKVAKQQRRKKKVFLPSKHDTILHKKPNRISDSKKEFIDNWLITLNRSRKECHTDQKAMDPAHVLSLPVTRLTVNSDRAQSCSSKIEGSEKTTVYSHQSAYYKALEAHNVYVAKARPPSVVVQHATEILSRSRTSAEMDDEIANMLMQNAKQCYHKGEDTLAAKLQPDLIPAVSRQPDSRMASSVNVTWNARTSLPLNPSLQNASFMLPRPKPDLAFGYSEEAFTAKQNAVIEAYTQGKQSHIMPDGDLRFPFLSVEFKALSKGGTHYVAFLQAATTLSIAMQGMLAVLERSPPNFDIDSLCLFSVSIDNQMARLNIHWTSVSAEGVRQYHCDDFRQYQLSDTEQIKTLQKHIKNILDHFIGAPLKTLCQALDIHRQEYEANLIHEPGPNITTIAKPSSQQTGIEEIVRDSVKQEVHGTSRTKRPRRTAQPIQNNLSTRNLRSRCITYITDS